MARVVVVTGGGSGMGKCMCRYFAEKGWVVCVADISGEGVKATVREITPLSPCAISFQLDTRNTFEVRHMIDSCMKRYEHIDAFVNNAGVTDKQHRLISEVPYYIWNEILSVNLFGTFNCVKEYISVISEQGYGNIVNVTSLLGQRNQTRIGDAAYGISKAAVEALTEYAASELSGSGININSAYPGAMVNTGFFNNIEKKEREKLQPPTIMNELVFVLCCLQPGELSGKSFSCQNWKQNLLLKSIYNNYLSGGG